MSLFSTQGTKVMRSGIRLHSTKAASLSQFGGVHGNKANATTMQWRNKPLFRRTGDVKFRTGSEAANLLCDEAARLDSNQTLFLQTYDQTVKALAPVFDRNPKFAWVAKTMVEPERMIQFRIAWLDDQGTTRLNRGFRVQYSSSLGPYEGGLHFGKHVNADYVKAMAFDTLCSNSLAGVNFGAASGGSDFDPTTKSEAEIQRFCQCFMTELSKYVGSSVDYPGTGTGVGTAEVGYLYGQYKRINQFCAFKGRGLLWGGAVPFPQAPGYGVVHFAEHLLKAAKKDSLRGKRVLVTGSGAVALAVAEKVLMFGGIPITLSDSSGHVYEEGGIDASKLGTLKKIKSDRGARIGRYIVSSTTAKYSEPENIFAIPCDVCIPCSGQTNEIGEVEAQLLADHGCSAVIEGSNMPSSPQAILAYKKRGLLFAPYKATLAVSAVATGGVLGEVPMKTVEELDASLDAMAACVYDKIKATAKEFNTRGDLNAGAQIAAFVKVADVMMAHGAV